MTPEERAVDETLEQRFWERTLRGWLRRFGSEAFALPTDTVHMCWCRNPERHGGEDRVYEVVEAPDGRRHRYYVR